MSKSLLALLAIVLTATGLAVGAPKASAAIPEFPSCITTKLDADTNRYWFDPGNLTPNVRSVQVRGVNMSRRRDGIWYADAPRPEFKRSSDVYFTYNFSKHKGAWASCRKPRPGVIR